MSSEPKLDPGLYSMFLLSDDGTWIQPTVETYEPLTETDLGNLALDRFGKKYFACYGVQADDDCPNDEFITKLPRPI